MGVILINSPPILLCNFIVLKSIAKHWFNTYCIPVVVMRVALVYLPVNYKKVEKLADWL